MEAGLDHTQHGAGLESAICLQDTFTLTSQQRIPAQKDYVGRPGAAMAKRHGPVHSWLTVWPSSPYFTGEETEAQRSNTWFKVTGSLHGHWESPWADPGPSPQGADRWLFWKWETDFPGDESMRKLPDGGLSVER